MFLQFLWIPSPKARGGCQRVRENNACVQTKAFSTGKSTVAIPRSPAARGEAAADAASDDPDFLTMGVRNDVPGWSCRARAHGATIDKLRMAEFWFEREEGAEGHWLKRMAKRRGVIATAKIRKGEVVPHPPSDAYPGRSHCGLT